MYRILQFRILGYQSIHKFLKMKRNAFFLFWLFNYIDCFQRYSNSVDEFFERFNRKAFPKDPNIHNNFNSNAFQNVHDYFDSLNNSKKKSKNQYKNISFNFKNCIIYLYKFKSLYIIDYILIQDINCYNHSEDFTY